MKKYIVLVVTTLILTGLAGCSMTKNRYNHYGVVKYLENKYDDKFEYYETYGVRCLIQTLEEIYLYQ